MAIMKPFKAIRPNTEVVSLVAALPYDVMSSEEAREMVKNNPYSFLHVDKAEIDMDKDINIYDPIVYEKAKENLNRMISKGIFIEEKKPMLYIYRQIMNGVAQTGIVGCTSIDDYINNIIKKHEYTREDKELDRINHVDYCNANTGPIFLTYKENAEIDKIVNTWVLKKPIYDFQSEDEIIHKVWVIDDESLVGKLCSLFKKVEYLYIADGHHRAASAVKVGLKRREQNPKFTGEEEFNYFLSVAFPHGELHIMDYNRVVYDLNGLSLEDYLYKVSDNFEVNELLEKVPYKPSCKHTYGMYYKGKWYKLVAKEKTYTEDDPVENLDVSILQNYLLKPILGIDDPRTDKRIDFVGGIRGLKELQIKSGDEGVAFSLYPTNIEELMNIADRGKVMPPKSTWFEPKLRSGIFIHRL